MDNEFWWMVSAVCFVDIMNAILVYLCRLSHIILHTMLGGPYSKEELLSNQQLYSVKWTLWIVCGQRGGGAYK